MSNQIRKSVLSGTLGFVVLVACQLVGGVALGEAEVVRFACFRNGRSKDVFFAPFSNGHTTDFYVSCSRTAQTTDIYISPTRTPHTIDISFTPFPNNASLEIFFAPFSNGYTKDIFFAPSSNGHTKDIFFSPQSTSSSIDVYLENIPDELTKGKLVAILFCMGIFDKTAANSTRAVLGAGQGSVLRGTVTDVHDGDTITVQGESGKSYGVRLAKIDAPELQQLYGDWSRGKLKDLVNGRRVRVVCQGKDDHGRILGIVYVDTVFGGELEVNYAMVRDGLAWHYKKNDQTYRYEQAEAVARDEKIGLWEDGDSPTPPWEFRQRMQE